VRITISESLSLTSSLSTESMAPTWPWMELPIEA